MGVISYCISVCSFPLPFIPSRQGRGKLTFDEFIKFNVHKMRACQPAIISFIASETYPTSPSVISGKRGREMILSAAFSVSGRETSP